MASLITLDMVEQIATLVWAHTGDSQIAENLATAKLMGEVWQRLSGEGEVDTLRSQTIMKISQFVKDHPRASKEELTREVGKLIADFAAKVEHM